MPCVATGNVHAHHRERARAPGRDRGGAAAVRRSTRPSPSAAATPRTCWPRPSGWRSASATTRTRSPRRRGWPSGSSSTSPRTSATATPARRIPTADRKLAELCRSRDRRALSRDGATGRGARAARGGAARDPPPRPVGLLPAPPRHARAGARGRRPRCAGPSRCAACCRPGAAAARACRSIVCYLTGLSHIDPIENELLPRALPATRSSPPLPDIDLDFPRDIRDVLIPRVHDRYGRDRCALVAAFATFQVRSAVRDFAKALGLPPGEIERLARAADPWKDAQRHPTGGGDRPSGVRLAALARADRARPRRLGAAAPPVPAPGRDGDLDPAADRPLPGAAGRRWRGARWCSGTRTPAATPASSRSTCSGLGMLSAVERCVDEIARVRGEQIDLSRIPYDDERGLRARSRRRRRWASSRSRAARRCRCCKRTLPGEPRRPHRAGRARAARADPGRRGASLHRAAQARCGPTRLRGALRAPVARAGAEGHARRDRLPGPGAGGGDGVRRLQRGRGRGAAPGDEPQALGGGDPRVRGEVRRRRDGSAAPSARSAERVCRQIVRLLGLRLPEGALGRVRAARLPVDLAARALRAGVPVRAAERAADGLLSARTRWCTRRSGGGWRCCLPASASGAVRVPGGGQGARVRIGLGYVQRGAGGGGPGARGRARAGRGLALARRPGRAVGRFAETLERLAWAGACDELVDGPVESRRRQALWQLGVAVPGVPVPEGTQLALPLEPHAGARAARALRLGADAGRLRLHRRDAARAPAGADAARACRRPAHEPRARARPATAAACGSRAWSWRASGRRPPRASRSCCSRTSTARINLIVPPPVYERYRLAVRAEPLVLATGRLERREGTINVLVDQIERLERPDLPRAEVKHIEPRRAWSTRARSTRLAGCAGSSFNGRGGPAGRGAGRAQLRQAGALARKRLPGGREVDPRGVEGDRPPLAGAGVHHPEPIRAAEEDEAAIGRPGELVGAVRA